MPTYVVTAEFVSGNLVNPQPPLEINWYRGDSLTAAVTAVAQLAADLDNTPARRLYESLGFTHVLSVRLDVEADCPWRDQPGPSRPSWAQHPCSGQEVETEVGTLCAAHHASMRTGTAEEVNAAEPASTSSEPPCQVGDPDPTPNTGVPCQRLAGNGTACTWTRNELHEWHVAGNGFQVVAVWRNEDDTD